MEIFYTYILRAQIHFESFKLSLNSEGGKYYTTGFVAKFLGFKTTISINGPPKLGFIRPR